MVEVQQQQQMNGGAALRLKEQPWCGKHVTNQESVATKNVYNYAHKNRNAEKTPMCRIAELTRFHKLKHEYVLLDESGPAHKKQFTVKLVLKQGEEYQGSGASIKKAQQTAAENALAHTSLQLPPRKQIKSKNETNPVWLLYSVAGQLGLAVRFEEQVEMTPLTKRPFMMSPSPNGFLENGQHPIFPFNTQGNQTNAFQSTMPPLMGPLNGFAQLFSQEQKPEIVCGPWSALLNPIDANLNYSVSPTPPSFQHSDSNFANCVPNSLISRISHSSNRINTPPPLIPFHPQLNMHLNTHRCTYLLSDGSEHKGHGRTLSSAKVDAALNALSYLRPRLLEMEAKMKDNQNADEPDSATPKSDESQETDDFQLMKQNTESSPSESDGEGETYENEVCTIACDDQEQEKNEDEPRKRRQKTKSVVSQIHECAYRLKMNVEFEVVKETGEPHNRRYVLRCSLSSPNPQQTPLIAVGEGSSKKIAKQNACQIMLDKVKGLDNDAVYLASVIVKQAAKKAPTSAANNKDVKRKTIIKDMKQDPQYGQHINPISRLIQVMQSRKESEPIFQLESERGQNRYREFVYRCVLPSLGMNQSGVGPNKKLAKRAAAVAMLEQIGYVKSMPQPGKSLLKKKSNDSIQPQVEIGVFDPSKECVNFSVDTCLPFNEPSIENLTDVDSVLSREINQLRFSSDSMSPPASIEQIRTRSNSEKQDESQPARLQRRRVTFSNQVSACPAPEDCSYPDSTIAPLKSEVVLVTKLKKRGRESKKALTKDEKFQIAATCRLFCQLPNGRELKSGYLPNEYGTKPISPESDYLDFGQPSVMSPIQPPSTPNSEFQSAGSLNKMQHPLSIAPPPTVSNGSLPMEMISPTQNPMDLVVRDAKYCLERLAKHYKFTVSYSDFPKGSMDEYFSLVTLGLDKPILCHGCGCSEEQAHNDAAYNAIYHLSSVDTQKVTTN